MARTLTLVVLLIAASYGVFKGWPLISGPEIALEVDGTDFTTISGRASNTETLTMNGSTLLIDENGHFEKRLTLPRGGAILSLTATDRFGRSHSVQRNLLVP